MHASSHRLSIVRQKKLCYKAYNRSLDRHRLLRQGTHCICQQTSLFKHAGKKINARHEHWQPTVAVAAAVVAATSHFYPQLDNGNTISEH
jgi:hypothetical protein